MGQRFRRVGSTCGDDDDLPLRPHHSLRAGTSAELTEEQPRTSVQASSTSHHPQFQPLPPPPPSSPRLPDHFKPCEGDSKSTTRLYQSPERPRAIDSTTLSHPRRPSHSFDQPAPKSPPSSQSTLPFSKCGTRRTRRRGSGSCVGRTFASFPLVDMEISRSCPSCSTSASTEG